jgi:hypothetical protein
MISFARVRPSQIIRARLSLEALEDRVLMAGNLLITTEFPGSTVYHLMEYAQDGTQISSQVVPAGPTESVQARGLSVAPSGDVNIYDGTFNPALATLSASTHTWSFQTFPGWSTVNNISYGEVAAYNNFVFASDMFTFNGGEPNGIVRFDSTGGTPVRFANGTDFIQVALGLDGKLYGLGGVGVQVYDPNTLAAVRTFSLNGGPDSDIRSIAVDGSGQVFAATWGGYLAKYNASGNYQTSIRLPGQFGPGENLINVALDTDGQIAVGGRFGEVYITDESLGSVQTIQTQQWTTFVTFNHYIGTQGITPAFSSLVGATITFGQGPVTLGGRITAGAAIPSGSVSITVGGITQLAAINPADGTFSADFDTSAIGVTGSPYTIDYHYPGDGTYAPLDDTSQTLTVVPAVTSLTNLTSPTISAGTPTVTVSGVLTSNSVLPAGQAVVIIVTDSNQNVVASGTATIASDGSFSVVLDTSTLSADSYAIQFQYVGDANFLGSTGNGTLTVTP